MRNYCKTVGALAAASTLVAGYASAELEGEVHVGYTNMYEFRFVDLGNDLVDAGVDVAYSMGDLSFSAGAWYATWDTDNATQATSTLLGGPAINNDELDLYGGVSYGIGDVTLELGYIYYYFPDAGANTQEVYLGASYDLPFGVSLGSTFYYDFDAFDGWYWDTSLGYTIEFNDCLSLELGAGVGFADGQGLQLSATSPTGTADGFQGWYLTAALPWEFREGVTLTPYVKYTDGDSDLITDLYATSGQEYLIGGVKLAVSF
ncbi:TorF family putative porin [Haloferula sargassicola]|uniref:Outer membrane protein beta-barrel domain-containing protein n=1 Tax=Haloferula sargassicola TaxID=490096 RepID=A0ABP9UR97_9BACT